MRKLLTSLLLPLLALTACSQDEPAVEAPTESPSPTERTFPANSFMAELQKKGKIVIGVKFDVPQFGSLNPATQKPEGFDVDLGNRIAEELGVEAEFLEAISANRIPFLQTDKVDLIISTMTINDERKQQIDFSNVYYIAEQRLLVKKDSKINEVADANNAGTTICSAKGSTSEKNIRAVAPKAKINLQDGYSQCFALLQNGQVQAVTTDNVILVGLLKNDPANFRITGTPFSKEPYGMGIKKGRVGFVDFVNEVLTDVKKDGTFVKLYDKWVKPLTGETATPPPDTAAAEAPGSTPAATTSPAAKATTPPAAGNAPAATPTY
ncbi:MAG: glutamate ABC transporter substrate-binding protein [Actinomycetota bacterium]